MANLLPYQMNHGYGGELTGGVSALASGNEPYKPENFSAPGFSKVNPAFGDDQTKSYVSSFQQDGKTYYHTADPYNLGMRQYGRNAWDQYAAPEGGVDAAQFFGKPMAGKVYDFNPWDKSRTQAVNARSGYDNYIRGLDNVILGVAGGVALGGAGAAAGGTEGAIEGGALGASQGAAGASSGVASELGTQLLGAGATSGASIGGIAGTGVGASAGGAFGSLTAAQAAAAGLGASSGAYGGGVGESSGVYIDKGGQLMNSATGLPVEGGQGALESAGKHAGDLKQDAFSNLTPEQAQNVSNASGYTPPAENPGWVDSAIGAGNEGSTFGKTMAALFGGGGGAGAGAGGGGLGWAGTALSLLSSGYGIYAANQMQDNAEEASKRADPFGPYRAQYAQQLSALEANPESIVNDPNYKLGLQGTRRALAKGGYRMSGNEMAALSDYSQHYVQDRQNQLASLAGAGFGPGNAGNLMLAGDQAKYNAIGNSLANLQWLSYRNSVGSKGDGGGYGVTGV